MSESDTTRIPFEVDISRIIEVLAKQIYQDPLALLRENTQNAFDAIRQRAALSTPFEPEIVVNITPTQITIRDNGIGMTPDDLRNHYWRAGSSSKNTPEARAAGVVGTFGIGAMANFGIADELTVETESVHSGERTLTSARRDTLSTTEDTITLTTKPSRGAPGTIVTATITDSQPIDIQTAVNYISQFVEFVDIPVVVNDNIVSLHPLADAVPRNGEIVESQPSWPISPDFTCDLEIRATAGTGEVSLILENISFRDTELGGHVILRQSGGPIRTYRNGFGLATATVRSTYNFGGIVDISVLQPTAGREALTTESMQLLQSLVATLDEIVSIELSKVPEADLNTPLMEWIRRNSKYELCDQLLARVEPDTQRVALGMLKQKSSERSLLIYSGNDQMMIRAAASDESPLVVLAVNQPRRQCEQEYLTRYCQHQFLDDTPTVLEETSRADWTRAEQALTFRITSILAADYFLTADVRLGSLSHGLPIVVVTDERGTLLFFDPSSTTFSLVCTLYDTDYTAFGSMAKDFVRNVVFPRVSDLVPSSTRQGAEAFLKSIRRTRDIFEYDYDDLESLDAVWREFLAGHISMTEAASRSTFLVGRNVQVLDSTASQSVRDVVPDVVDNEGATASEALSLEPAPSIARSDISSEAKLLTIDAADNPLKGYRCFVAMSDRAREERGEFFLQPHSTSIVWGGQKVLFVFEHHSGEFGLYYDLQTPQVVSTESGGGPFPTCTIVLKNRIFIPIPDVIVNTFLLGEGERKRFEVRCDLLYTDIRSRD